jgi:hypothetical protein
VLPDEKWRNPLIRLVSATLHGVVFDIFDEVVPKGTKMSTTVRTRQGSGD